MKIESLSKLLAIKMGDTVVNGTDDGQKYSNDLRVGYLSRAYFKTIKTLEAIGIKLYEYLPDYMDVYEGKLSDYEYKGRILSVYIKTDKKLLSASFYNPINFISVTNDINERIKGTITDYKWTVIKNKLQIFPNLKESSEIKIIFIKDYDEFNTSNGTNINLPNSFISLLLLNASLEAYSDRGNQAKYQLTATSINTEIELLKGAYQNQKIEDVE